MIDVLVIDDSVVIRRLLADMIDAEPDMRTIATASNGKLGVEKIERHDPDVVTLDVEMPVMDGLATLRELRQRGVRKPIIMFSTLTDKGGEATLDAMALGASDYVTKPSNTGSFDLSRARVRAELVPKIRALVPRARPPVPGAVPGAASRRRERVGSPAVRPGASPFVDIVAIGCSTGGPNALAEVIPNLPSPLGVPVVLVQHMPPLFTGLMAKRLDAMSSVRVVEAEHEMPIEDDTVYVAPGDHHLTVQRAGTHLVALLDQGPPENSCRPAVDPLFRSVVSVFGRKSLAVVLTGMGHDGAAGARAIHDAGGQVFVQDAATSVVWGMPGAVVEAGHADAVLPLAEVPSAILSRLHRRSVPAGALR